MWRRSWREQSIVNAPPDCKLSCLNLISLFSLFVFNLQFEKSVFLRRVVIHKRLFNFDAKLKKKSSKMTFNQRFLRFFCKNDKFTVTEQVSYPPDDK
jgi:hypothetical protein